MAFKMSQEFPSASLDITPLLPVRLVCLATSSLDVIVDSVDTKHFYAFFHANLSNYTVIDHMPVARLCHLQARKDTINGRLKL